MTHVWGDTYASGSGNTTSGLVYPAAGVVLFGDVGQLEVTFTGGGGVVVTVPSGWTLFERHDYSTTMWTNVYRKTMAGGETGAIPISWTGSASKIAEGVIIKRGVDFGPSAWLDQAGLTTATCAVPAVTVDPAKAYSWSTFATYRGSAPPTGTTPPAGTTQHDSMFGSGGGAASMSIASNDTSTTDVSTLGSGTWTWNTAGSGGRAVHMQSWVEAAEVEPPVDPPPATIPAPYRFQIDVPSKLIVGHRGGNPGPEETIYAYRNSYASAPASWTEGDIQLLSTGEAVLHHDDTIDRLADATSPILTGRVDSFTLTQWRTIRLRQDTGFSGNPPQPPGELIHLRDEYGPGTGRTRGQFLEIKQGTDATAFINQLIAAKLDWCTIVNGYNLADVAEAVAAGLMGCYQTNAPNFTTIASYGINWVSVEKDSATTTMCTNAHAAGIKVIVYTVNSTSDRDIQFAKGVDGVFTNKVATVTAGVPQPFGPKIRFAGANKVRKASCVVINGEKKHIAKTRVVIGGIPKKQAEA